MSADREVMAPESARNLSPVTLAFVGDAVYSLHVRKNLVLAADLKAGELSKLSSLRVSAQGQSALVEKLITEFTEDEAEVYRRGRNAKKTARAKHASVSEYNRSTGFEAVLGYLYLTGRHERIEFLLKGHCDEN